MVPVAENGFPPFEGNGIASTFWFFLRWKGAERDYDLKEKNMTIADNILKEADDRLDTHNQGKFKAISLEKVLHKYRQVKTESCFM